MKKKICIIGAGITGLSISRLLSRTFETTIYESSNVIGGIARTISVDGITYHTVGGHCFNSKHQEVLDFVFNDILPKQQWHIVKRISKINFGSFEVDYPIEFSIQQIYRHNPQLAIRIVNDFVATNDDSSYTNLEEWFKKKFGTALSELYFLPYNRKIWHNDPSLMSSDWVKDKLPIPDKETFIESLLCPKADDMPHASFYYPNTNNMNSFIEAMAKGLTIKFNTPVFSIKKKNGAWLINDTDHYDIIINTSPLNILPSLISGCPSAVINFARQLKVNPITNVLWKSNPTDKTWTYLPSAETDIHRTIHIGNYFTPKANYSISEAIGYHSYEDMIHNAKTIPYLEKPIAYNYGELAYVVFDQNYNRATSAIKEYLQSIGLHSIGRFGEWQYYNMDICILQSLKLANELNNQID